MTGLLELKHEADAFRALICRLCSDNEGAWREGALGYLLVQTRERAARIETLDPRAFLELKHILEIARRISTLRPGDRRAQAIARVGMQCVGSASAAYERMDKSLDSESRAFLEEVGTDLTVLLRRLAGH